MEGPHPGTPVLLAGLSSPVESRMRSGAWVRHMLCRQGSGVLSVRPLRSCLPPSLCLLAGLWVICMCGCNSRCEGKGPKAVSPCSPPLQGPGPLPAGGSPLEHDPQGGRVSFRTDLLLRRLSPSSPFSLRRSGRGEVGVTLLWGLSS